MRDISHQESWGWMIDGEEVAHGPFDTRDQALKDAREENPQGGQIILCRPEFAAAEDYVPYDIDQVLDDMHACAEDDYAFYDDEIFELNLAAGPASDPPKAQAQIELTNALAAWARKWVTSAAWIAHPVETVQLEPREERKRI